jgi:outer membrane protein insertion porin family
VRKSYRRRRFFAALVGVLAASGVEVAHAAGEIGEPITDIRVLDNRRTGESTVLSIAGLSIGDIFDEGTLDVVRERLNSSGLFADVNVWWEPYKSGVRVDIAVRDKFPWAPVPTASWSANNKSVGLVFVHGNLFGRDKQLLIGARLATVDSGATLAIRDPAFLGSWVYWQLQGSLQKQVIPEYDPNNLVPIAPLRETHLVMYGVEPSIGVAWFRRVRTQIAWHLQHVNFDGSDIPAADATDTTLATPQTTTEPATTGGTDAAASALLTFDFRAREFAVSRGMAVAMGVSYASPLLGSDFTYWRAGASVEQGFRLFKTHNLILFVSGTAGHNLPFWAENTAGGPNLRGYLYQQFRGDTQGSGKIEYHFPLFSIKSLDVRGLGFYDVSAIWFRETPGDIPVKDGGVPPTTYYLRNTPDMRTFPAEVEQGFSKSRDVHNDVGAGLRFFLRSVAIPLVGFDAGYGIEARTWRFLVVVGA